MIESFFLTSSGLTMTLILCDSARWPGEEEAAIEQILLEKFQTIWQRKCRRPPELSYDLCYVLFWRQANSFLKIKST